MCNLGAHGIFLEGWGRAHFFRSSYVPQRLCCLLDAMTRLMITCIGWQVPGQSRRPCSSSSHSWLYPPSSARSPTSADSISALMTAHFLMHAVLADYPCTAAPVQRERYVTHFSFWALTSNIPFPGLEKADFGTVDQRGCFGCRRASFTPG